MKIRKILVSQPEPNFANSPYHDLAAKNNLKIDFRPFIQVEGVPAKDFRKDKVSIMDHTAVIFTSRTAIDHFFRLSTELRLTIPDTMKYFCISEATAFYLQKYVQFRKRKIFFSENDVSQLMDLIKKHKTERFLLPCSDNHSKELPDLLDAAKINYSEAVLYRTVPAEMKSLVDIYKFDMLVFFSPQGIRSLFHNWPDFKQGEIAIGTFGTTTSQAATEAGLSVNLSAPNPTTPSMTMAIDAYLSKCQKKA